MRTTSKTLAFYVLGMFITIAGFSAIIELTTRTVSWIRGDGFGLALHELDAADSAITDIYQFHPFTGFTFKPNQVFLAGHPGQDEVVRVRTDEHGFLSESDLLPIGKGANEIRIAMIGASTTANINLKYRDNWPGRLGELVQQALPDEKITVINAAVPGFNTAQSIGNLALRVMPFKPDLVIIYHAYNDLKVVRPDFEVKPDFSNVHKQPYGSHERPNLLLGLLNKSMLYVRTRNSYREYKKTAAIVEKTEAIVEIFAGDNRFASDIRLDQVPISAAVIFEHNIRMLIACALAGGAKVVVSSFATLHELDAGYDDGSIGKPLTPLKRHELFSVLQFTPGLSLDGIFGGISRYNNLLKKVALERNTGWVDNANLIAHVDENFIDRVHLSSAGAERMAQNFLPVVLDQLRGGTNSTPCSAAE